MKIPITLLGEAEIEDISAENIKKDIEEIEKRIDILEETAEQMRQQEDPEEEEVEEVEEEEEDDHIEREIRDLKAEIKNQREDIQFLYLQKQGVRSESKLYLEDLYVEDISITDLLKKAIEDFSPSVIVLPEGRFTFTEPIVLPAGVSLEGCGIGNTIIDCNLDHYRHKDASKRPKIDGGFPSLIYKEGSGSIRDLTIELDAFAANGICYSGGLLDIITIDHVELLGHGSAYAQTAILSEPGDKHYYISISNAYIDGWKLGVCLQGHMCKTSTFTRNCNTGIMFIDSTMCLDTSIVENCQVGIYTPPTDVHANGIYDGSIEVHSPGEIAQADIGIFKVGEPFL